MITSLLFASANVQKSNGTFPEKEKFFFYVQAEKTSSTKVLKCNASNRTINI